MTSHGLPSAPAMVPLPLPLPVHWLVRLRWAAIAAQIVSLFGVKFLLHAPFPTLPLVLIVGFLAALNGGLSWALRRTATLSERAIAGHLLVDILALTGLLIWTGGAMNPFTTLYLLQVALAAILVRRRWSLVVALGAVISFGGLLLARPEAIHVWHSGEMFLLHVRGMWLAFALTAACLWYFVERVSHTLRAREEALARAQLEAVQTERMASLARLAAGTAHELNTPLGTVAILAAELSDTLAEFPEAREQAELIRQEVRRCTLLLGKMRSPELQGSPTERVVLRTWLRSVVDRWQQARVQHDVKLSSSGLETAEAWELTVQPESLRQAVFNVLDNASRATAPGQPPPE